MTKTKSLAIALSICCANALYADDNISSNTYTLQEITVVSKDNAEDDENTKVTAEEIKQRQAKTTKEIFATEPSVSVGGGSSHAQRLYLRGVEQSNLLVTIDGAEQGRSMHQRHGSALRIDPSILKQVEIDTMPGADAGPGALGGAIRFTTVDAQDLLDEGKIVGATLRAGYSSMDNSTLKGISLYSKLFDKGGILFSATDVEADDYKMGNGEKVKNSADDDKKYFLKVSFLDMDGHSIRLNAQKDINEGTRVWNKDGSDIGYTQDNSLIYPMKKIRQTQGIEHTYKSINPLLNTLISANQNKSKFEWNGNDRENKIKSGNIKNTATIKFLNSEHKITTGVDYNKEESTSSSNSTAYTSKNYGFYIQDRMNMGNLSLSFGARQDYYDSDLGVMQLKGNDISSNFGMDYKLTNNLSAFWNYGEAMRTKGNIPTMWLLMADENTTYNGKKLNQNPDPFKPETSEKIEYGIKYKHKNIFNDIDSLNTKITVFNTKIDNLIGGTGGGGDGIKDISNLPRLVSKGYELRVGYDYNNDIKTAFTYSNTKVRDKDGNPYTSSTGKRNGGIPGEKIVWDSKWFVSNNWMLGYTLTYARDLKDVPAGYDIRKGYVLHDIQTIWTPEKFKNTEFALAVSNLFDKAYTNSTTLGSTDDTRVYDPGRDIRVSMTYKF